MDYFTMVECENVTGIKESLLGHHLKALLMLITMAQSPASYLIHTPRFNMPFFCDQQEWSFHMMSILL